MTQDPARHFRGVTALPIDTRATDCVEAGVRLRPGILAPVAQDLMISRCAEALDGLLGLPRALARKDLVSAFQRVCLALGASRMWLVVYRNPDAPEVSTVYEAGSPRWRAEQMPALRKLLVTLPRLEPQSVVSLNRLSPDGRFVHDADVRAALFDGVQAGLMLRVEGRLSGSPQGALMIGWSDGTRDMVELPLCHAIANHAALLALDAHQRLPTALSGVQVDTRLSSREAECLHWAAVGKTSWETAQILEVRERTVNFHLGNAFGKLNVNNKQAAVARALMLGLLGNMEL
ncbi:LuxR C-terminal-related transcriptional regulator [Pigmentiphaga aceris]|nr:LuxR C-terminal-related transcriptional regulator [Pigmentiphaga aceris]